MNVCIFVNLEQLGQGGANVLPAYLALLRRSAVLDYEAAKVAVYANDPAEAQLVPFQHAPYLGSEGRRQTNCALADPSNSEAP